jgi:hypothetical protein
MYRFLLLILSLLFIFAEPLYAVDINVRDTTTIGTSGVGTNGNLATFIGPIMNFFYTPIVTGDSVTNTFISIAWGIKDFVLIIAALFLTIWVLKLLFSWGDEESVKKWKNNIIWVSVGVFVMQIAYSVWRTLYLQDAIAVVDGGLGWLFWINILEPIVNIMLLLASFGFIAMAIYSFYTIITGGGDEEKVKKGKNMIIYALIGFLLIRIPKTLVTAIYGTPAAGCGSSSFFSIGSCTIGNSNLGAGINIFWRILTYINSFLALFAVVMVIYAGYLILISGGDEEKLKKAKNTIIYIAIGVVALVGSHALFRFFFLQG